MERGGLIWARPIPMTQIRFIRGGSNTMIGNFAPGEVLRCGDALAKHFVQDVKVAEYIETAQPQAKPRKRERK